MIAEEAVWEQLKELKDSMFGTPLSVVDVGLVYEVKVTEDDVHVVVTLFNRGHVQINSLTSAVRQKILGMEGVGEVKVECAWEPAWTPDRLNDAARQALRFEEGDPPEGKLHVRSEKAASLDGSVAYDERTLDSSPLLLAKDTWGKVADLPGDRFGRWRGGWRYFKRFDLTETRGLGRSAEPVHLEVAFATGQILDPEAEIRLLAEGSDTELRCQVNSPAPGGSTDRCTVVFLADLRPHERKTFYLLYGNPSPACWAPSERSDLIVSGRGYALEIENDFYRARLSPVMGQLRNLEFRRWGHTSLGWEDPTPIDLTDATNDPARALDIAWHGEDSCIHWNPDFSDQLRYRITNWPEPPNYTVVKGGSVYTRISRWGYPVCPVYPALPQTAVAIEVTYTFYSGLPYFTMESRLDVEEEVDINVIRNDEWLFRKAFSHTVSMMDGGEISVDGADGPSFDENPALVGFVQEDNGDAFASLNLSYDSRGFPGAYHPKDRGLGTIHDNRIWVRWAFHADGGAHTIQPGATLGEYNAYLVYNAGEEGGHNQARERYNLPRHPLKATAS